MRLIDAEGNMYGVGDVVLIDNIKSIPTADVVPVVRGRWIGKQIYIETCDITTILQECSICHKVRPIDNYCGHCGAKMDLLE